MIILLELNRNVDVCATKDKLKNGSNIVCNYPKFEVSQMTTDIKMSK